MQNRLPEEVLQLVNTFLREMSKRNIGVFGMLAQLEPEPAIAVIRNSDTDPAESAEAMLRMIKDASKDGRIQKHDVPWLN